MAYPPPLLLILFISTLTLLLHPSQSRLFTDYYQKMCPRFDQIIQDTITNKQITSSTTAVAILCLFFYDCILNGCDASILVSSTPFNKAAGDANINLFLPSNGFDVVVRAKTAIELTCPRVVSCADILAVATRDLVTMVGGPYYDVRLGRIDGFISKSSTVEGNLPRPTMSISQIIDLFQSRGFTVVDSAKRGVV